MKLVDLFSFSEPHEADVLWVKLNLAASGMNEWIVIENEYTFRGERKGHTFAAIFYGQRRFDAFHRRVRYLPCSIPLKGHIATRDGVYDDIAREVEYQQREIGRSYVLANYQPEDIVLLSDCDECVDLSHKGRRDLLASRLEECEDFMRIPHTRFWYDYDNLWSEVRSIPAVRVGYLRSSDARLSEIRFLHCGTNATQMWEQQVAFEYSYCFDRLGVLRKHDTFFHTGFLRSEVETAIACNHRPVSSLRGQTLDLKPEWWFRQVRLTETNSPQFVREHIHMLRTNTVPADYRRRRRHRYPELFGLRSQVSWHRKQALERIRALLRHRVRAYARALVNTSLGKAVVPKLKAVFRERTN